MQTTAEPIPAILNLNQAIQKFREMVTPLIDSAQEESWDGVKLKEREWAILWAGLELVGHCVAILIYHLSLTESVKLAADVRVRGKAGFNCVNQAIKEVPNYPHRWGSSTGQDIIQAIAKPQETAWSEAKAGQTGQKSWARLLPGADVTGYQ